MNYITKSEVLKIRLKQKKIYYKKNICDLFSRQLDV